MPDSLPHPERESAADETPSSTEAATRRLIDTDRYPIDAPESAAARALVADCRAALADDGCVVLRDFVRPEALARMTAESRARSHRAHFNQTRTNPYSSDDDPSLPADHPTRTFMTRTNGFVAGDLLEDGTEIRRLYHDDALRRFIAACMGVDRLYEYADPLAGLVVNVLKPGCQHPWHFDNNDFIVTLLTQKADGGGLFEYCPGLRDADDQNIAGVKRVLHGDRGPVKTLDLRAGDLQIFFGRNALHRVTEIEGARERHTVILGYAEQPGQIAGAARTKRLFGRISDAHRRAEETGRTLEATRA